MTAPMALPEPAAPAGRLRVLRPGTAVDRLKGEG